MTRPLIVALLLLAACGSDTSGNEGTTGSTGGESCPDVSGNWKVTAHCDPSLVGQGVSITEKSCGLTFAAPFNGFTGTVTEAGKITLSGPQSCTGDASATAVTMSCTPGTCTVTLAR